MLILKLPLYLPHTLDLRIKMWGFFLWGSPHPQPLSRSWRPRAKGAYKHHSLSREERAGESQGKGFIPSPIMPGMGEGQGEGYFRVRGILLPTFLKLYLYPSQLLRLLL